MASVRANLRSALSAVFRSRIAETTPASASRAVFSPLQNARNIPTGADCKIGMPKQWWDPAAELLRMYAGRARPAVGHSSINGDEILQLFAAAKQQRPFWSGGQRENVPCMRNALFGAQTFGCGGFNRDVEDCMVLHRGNVRGFAKSVSVPPQMQKPMKLKLYMGSPGVIGEPYKIPPPRLPVLRRWFTMEGWRRRKQSFMGMIKTSYTIAKLRQKTKGYTQQRFYQEASDLYRQINLALAQGERTALRQLVTESVFSAMKNELKHRETAWAKVTWELVGPIDKIRTLQGRLIGVDKNNHDNAFVQLTLRILSKQKFAAYDKRGKLVAGDPGKELSVVDYWVFEKPLLVTEAKWRLCGRLSV